jgi:hypothetical protein
MVKAIIKLVLDLDGDGVETKHVDNGVFFDIDNDGFDEKVGWVKGDDGKFLGGVAYV